MTDYSREELMDIIEGSNKEIMTWRRDFLDEIFLNPPFKFISEKDKTMLSSFFMLIPSKSFSTPWQEWNNCISTLLQFKDEHK